MKYLILLIFVCTAFAEVKLIHEQDAVFKRYTIVDESGAPFKVEIDKHTYLGCSSPFEYQIFKNSDKDEYTLIKRSISVCKARVYNPFQMGVTLTVPRGYVDSNGGQQHASRIEILVPEHVEIKTISEDGSEMILTQQKPTP